MHGACGSSTLKPPSPLALRRGAFVPWYRSLSLSRLSVGRRRVRGAQTVAIGQKMDLMFSLLRLDFIHGDYIAVKANLGKARKLFQEGGDWERKNRLKV